MREKYKEEKRKEIRENTMHKWGIQRSSKLIRYSAKKKTPTMEMIKMAFKDIIEKFSEIKEKVKLHPERTQKAFLKYTNNI